MTDRVLGVDYVVLKGKGGRDTTNGAVVDGDTSIHLGSLFDRLTVCGMGYTQFLVTYSDVEITCTKCVRILTERAGL